jgi:hypothetical protein
LLLLLQAAILNASRLPPDEARVECARIVQLEKQQKVCLLEHTCACSPCAGVICVDVWVGGCVRLRVCVRVCVCVCVVVVVVVRWWWWWWSGGGGGGGDAITWGHC